MNALTPLPASETALANGASPVVPADPYGMYPTKVGKLLAELADAIRDCDGHTEIDAAARDVDAVEAYQQSLVSGYGKSLQGDLHEIARGVRGALDTRAEYVEFNNGCGREWERE